MTNKQAKIWFITGISSGLEKALAEAVMNHGDFVIGTFRDSRQVDQFNGANSEKGAAFKLDINENEQIAQVVSNVTAQFGRVDVLVNNAGYGFAGAVEEASESEIRAAFETNFFGTLSITQAFLPLFRQQQSGHIIQISSHSGIKGFAGFGIYSASKFALEGISEALAAEIAPLGIKLTLIEPGPFRTYFADTSLRQAANRFDDYEPTAGAFRNRMQQVNGQQEGNPVKAAAAIIQITQTENPPLRLPLGKIAISTLTAKLQSVQQDLDNWREVAASAVY
ncbi:oxidoreductase [Dyadobacter pollutisoli]|uniref:Oxidoreductase n=1 Tax=Dyadobacter pollutisoli TaxID=2910158 RepID=A0A9E8NE09_9BACT|nr:oxidoreductase [Dyadobacter pollutisoli]WAC12429.1 oxidoreductase [Dyadobacter pollutisoli]